MEFEWDEEKNQLNIVKHGFDFVDAQFLFDNAVLSWVDDRKDYGEKRFIGLGKIQNDVAVLVYTMRQETLCRVISLRRANKNEQRKYYSWIKTHEK